MGFRGGKIGSFCTWFILSLEAYLDYVHIRRSGQASPPGAETLGKHTLQMHDGQKAVEAIVDAF